MRTTVAEKTDNDKMRNPTGNVDPTSTDELFLISRNDKSLAHLLEFVNERKISHDSPRILL